MYSNQLLLLAILMCTVLVGASDSASVDLVEQRKAWGIMTLHNLHDIGYRRVWGIMTLYNCT